jgi:hypothetical protein
VRNDSLTRLCLRRIAKIGGSFWRLSVVLKKRLMRLLLSAVVGLRLVRLLRPMRSWSRLLKIRSKR